jgi:sec-independent protein translocase protein TatB
MFGLTFEKLFVVALLAAVIIGPRRLPDYATRAAELLRRLATLAADTRQRVAEESDAVDWRSLDPRQYDPRRIIREAWADAEKLEGDTATPAADAGEAESQGSATAPGRWLVSGSSAHPRRVWVPETSDLG